MCIWAVQLEKEKASFASIDIFFGISEEDSFGSDMD